jgi:hypothetical protein
LKAKLISDTARWNERASRTAAGSFSAEKPSPESASWK